MKKFLSVLLVLSMLCALTPAFAAASFTDVSGHWAEGAINAMAEAGAVDGYPDGTFRPDEPVTRAEFAKIITEYFDLPASDYGWYVFDDVDGADWYAPYVVNYKVLVFDGFKDWPDPRLGENYGVAFEAEAPVTRIEAALPLLACGCREKLDESMGRYEELSDAFSALAAEAAKYTDFEDLGSENGSSLWLAAALASSAGLMTGDGEGRFRPWDGLSRAELCTLLTRCSKDVNDYIVEEISDYNIRLNRLADFMSEEKKTDADRETVATICGTDVSLADYNYIYNIWAALYEDDYGEDWASRPCDMYGAAHEGYTLGNAARAETLSALGGLVCAAREAAEHGWDSPSLKYTAAEEMYTYINTEYDSLDEHRAELENIGSSLYAEEKYEYMCALMYMLEESYIMPGGLYYATPEEVVQNYLKAGHVLILADGDTDDAEAKARAEEVIARLDAGEDMRTLIDECGEDPGMRNRDYYMFTEGDMVDEFYEGTKALEPGQYSKEPVKTDYGYHVIYRLPITGDEPEIEELREELSYKKFDALVDEWMTEICGNIGIKSDAAGITPEDIRLISLLYSRD